MFALSLPKNNTTVISVMVLYYTMNAIFMNFLFYINKSRPAYNTFISSLSQSLSKNVIQDCTLLIVAAL